MRVEIKILGPIDVTVAGVSAVPSASKPCQLLALLALNAGRVVTADALMEEIWDLRPPRSRVPTLHTYILQIRKKFQDALEKNGDITSKDILVTRRAGYLLDVNPDNVDALRYDTLSSLGRRALNGGDHDSAGWHLAEALGLWRGPALADLPTGPQLVIEAMRLEENRLGDLHLRIDADLRLGRHYQLLGELAALCARHPLLENLRAQFMIALYRSGRQCQALDSYQQLRAMMIDQLGVEPSPRVRQLHHAILTGHPAMDDPNFVSSWESAALAS
jgi:SARP family transcriptional regulator, regulator of embCAB operon